MPLSIVKRLTSTLSTVHQGTAFEMRSVDILQRQLSMSLTRVGGRGDGGVDLQGWWWVPEKTLKGKKKKASRETSWIPADGISRRRLRVLGQCKAEKKKVGPNYVRELEGVVAMRSAEKEPTIGMLVSQSPFTRAAVLRCFSSTLPLFLLHLPPESEEEVQDVLDSDDSEGDHEGLTDIGAALWNPALGSAKGILNGQLELRWERSLTTLHGRPGLWWKGQKLEGYTPP